VLRQYDGDLDGALADLRAARALGREFGELDLADQIFLDLRWADLHLRLGDQAEAVTAVASARARAERSFSAEMILLVDALEAGMCLAMGDLDKAGELVSRATRGLGRAEMPMMGGDHGVAIVYVMKASLEWRLGDLDTAEKSLVIAYSAAKDTRDMPILALVAVSAGGLALRRGQHRDAALLLGAASRLRGAHDHTDLNVAEISAGVRAALGDEGFGEAYAAGWSLDSPAAQLQVDPARFTRALEPGPSGASGPS
jgi:hypothetical protein